MAEINVEPRKQQSSPAWIWIVLVLAVVVAVAYFLTRNNSTEEGVIESNTTAYVHSLKPAHQSVLYI